MSRQRIAEEIAPELRRVARRVHIWNFCTSWSMAIASMSTPYSIGTVASPAAATAMLQYAKVSSCQSTL